MESPQGQVVSAADSRLRLRSRLGALTLLLLCAVQFLDIVNASIVNVALPSIQRNLHFSQQNLQWVASGYILTYGGFLLLGGRLGDLLGRRRMLITGLTVFAVASLTAGLANTSGLLVAARLVQGAGAALMAPAALSQLTTTFREGKDRNTALGAWGGSAGWQPRPASSSAACSLRAPGGGGSSLSILRSVLWCSSERCYCSEMTHQPGAKARRSTPRARR